MISTSETLLHQLRDTRNQVGWEQFARIYSPLLFKWVQQKGLQHHDANDVVQKIFQVLVLRLPEFEYDPSKSFRNWLYTIMLNVLRDHRRNAVRQARLSSDLDEEIGQDDLFSESQYRREVLGRAIELIRPEYRSDTWEAFLRYGIQGEPVADVARSLGMTVGAVYTIRCRVIGRLRNLLREMLD